MPKTSPWIPLVSLLAMVLCALSGPTARAQNAGPRVIVDSSPAGATVYVDGKERGVQGYSSSTFKLRLSKGPHRVLLELEGYKPVEQTINVTQAQKFTFTMDRAPARLDVKSPGTNETARGGEVFVDGAPAGTVPVPVEVTSGRHLIEVRKPGYRVYSETIELRAGDSRTLWVTLQSEVKAGSLLVSADGNAEVYVDGQPRGPAPVLVDNLPEGDHLVEVRRTEPGSPPWRQNVRVTAGQQVKVLAHTQPAAQTGSLMVNCPIPDADVVVDNSVRGKVNQEIGNLRPGQHVVEVSAKGYAPLSRVVEVEVNKQRVEKVDLLQSAEGRGIGVLRVIMVNPVDGAQYYINGRKYDESSILSERGVEVASGTNIVVVRKDNFGEVRHQVNLRPGTTETVTVDLRNVGKIFITSDPRGAQVLIDKAVVGQTPYTAEDVQAGPHMVELTMPEHAPFVEQVLVRGGQQQNVNALMLRPPSGGMSETEKRKGMSSFSALTVEPGGFTADFGSGFPYFLDARLTVGVARINKSFGVDAGVELRTTFYETDILANLRVQIVRVNPIAFGANITIGGGGGPRKRNGFVFEAGLPITLLAGNLVRVTARPYLQIYSDRLCPSYSDLQDAVFKNPTSDPKVVPPGLLNLLQPEHVGDRCSGAGDQNSDVIAAGLGYKVDASNPQGFSTVSTPVPLDQLQQNANYRLGDTFLLDRFFGVRFMLQAVVEVAISPNANLWVLIEGAPFQPERQSYTDKFNRIFPLNDFPIYGRGGFSLKF